MKILVLHNRYQLRGGEDAALEVETSLLTEYGHTVVAYQRDNKELHNRRGFASLRTGLETVWASQSYRELVAILAKERPDVAHFHNTLPLISPAAYYACAEARVPVVQTLHNYRLLCPSATLMREGEVCEACLGRSVPWPGVVHACYRGSRAATAAIAAMIAVHRVMGTWRQKVKVYVALSEFARRKFIEGGLPAHRVVVKSHCVDPDPGVQKDQPEYAAYAGRLSDEKGIHVLLESWSRLSIRIPLRIAGEGPLKGAIVRQLAAGHNPDVKLLGHLEHKEIIKLMRKASFLVYPSQCYETFGLTIIEAFACGVPVIASRLGSMAEIVTDGKTGLHFSPGEDADLAAKVEWAWTHPDEMQTMGREARAEYEAKYTAKRGLDNLMSVYRQALERSS
jgi:glycosyltransferase involved in cell wall biosynthesis